MAQSAAQQSTSLRNKIERDLKYLPPFNGESKMLPAFINSVDRVMVDYDSQKDLTFQIVFDLKIQGDAKNYLQLNRPADWDICKQRLKQHFKSSKDQMQLTRDITSLRVSSIFDLSNKVKAIINYVTEFCAFDDNGVVMRDIFSGMLIQRIKQLASGTFAYAIRNKISLASAEATIHEFIGMDEGNLNTF